MSSRRAQPKPQRVSKFVRSAGRRACKQRNRRDRTRLFRNPPNTHSASPTRKLPVCQSAYPGIASWNNPKASALKGSPGAWHLTKLSRADLSRSPRGGKEKKCVVRTVPSACHPAILATHLCRRGGPAGRPKRIDEVGK